MTRRTNRAAWGLAVVLIQVLLLTWLQPYRTAGYRGQNTDLRGALLVRAPLASALLYRANLVGACLCYADLCYADLRRADLRSADLHGANLCYADLAESDLRGARFDAAVLCEVNRCGFIRGWTYPKLSGATYDEHTRWPFPLDPQRHGTVMSQ